MILVCSVTSKPDVHAPCCPKLLVRGEGGAVPWAFVDSLSLCLKGKVLLRGREKAFIFNSCPFSFGGIYPFSYPTSPFPSGELCPSFLSAPVHSSAPSLWFSLPENTDPDHAPAVMSVSPG